MKISSSILFPVLDHQIDLHLYERQSENAKKLNNFADMVPAPYSELARDVMKDPYIFEVPMTWVILR